MATVSEDLHQVITEYADLLDSLTLPGSSQEVFISRAQSLAERAEQLRGSLDGQERQAATLLSEIAGSCQSLISGSDRQLLGRHGLRIRLLELGLIS